MSYQTACNGCGLDLNDLPLDALELDPEDALDAFFELDDSGDLYCEGCVGAGLGVFL